MKKSNTMEMVHYVPTSDDKTRLFAEALMDPANHGKSPKNIAIACGLNISQMVSFYRDNVMAEALMRAADVMASKVEDVVSATLETASDPDSSERDKRLALEILGFIGDKKSNTPVNVNVNQANVGHPGFEDAAKKGTVAINLTPES